MSEDVTLVRSLLLFLISLVAMTCTAALGADSSNVHCAVPVIVRADGSIEFDGTRINDDKKMVALLMQYHKQNPKCEMHIRGDAATNFQVVGRVIFAMQEAGFFKVGFLTAPRN